MLGMPAFYHDSAACLVQDAEIMSAVSLGSSGARVFCKPTDRAVRLRIAPINDLPFGQMAFDFGRWLSGPLCLSAI
jgi:hypothetical protein